MSFPFSKMTKEEMDTFIEIESEYFRRLELAQDHYEDLTRSYEYEMLNRKKALYEEVKARLEKEES